MMRIEVIHAWEILSLRRVEHGLDVVTVVYLVAHDFVVCHVLDEARHILDKTGV